MSSADIEVRDRPIDVLGSIISNSVGHQLTGRFSISLRERRVLLAFLDFLAGGLACLAAYEIIRPPAMAQIPAFAPFLYGAGWIIGLFLVNGYALQIPASRALAAIAVAKATPFVGLVGVVTFFIEPYVMTRPLIISTTLLGAFCIIVARLTFARLLLHGSLAVRVLLVGGPNPSSDIREMLHAARHEFRVVAHLAGAFDDEVQRAQMVDELMRILGSHRVHEVIVASNAMRFIPGLAEVCLTNGVRVVSASRLVERYLGRVQLSDIDTHWYLGLPDSDLWERPYALLRRVVDIAVAIAVGVLFLLLLPILALLIKLESPGPVLITQRRLGQNGREFNLVKLRTMREDAEVAGAQLAAVGDPRVTRIGRLLRLTHLDELPQAVNIVRGDMSLIGPRPERPELMRVVEAEIPSFRARLLVKPGLTGWAQVNCGYASTVPDFVRKLEHDAYYIKNRSLRLDMQILGLTLFSVMGLKGR